MIPISLSKLFLLWLVTSNWWKICETIFHQNRSTWEFEPHSKKSKSACNLSTFCNETSYEFHVWLFWSSGPRFLLLIGLCNTMWFEPFYILRVHTPNRLTGGEVHDKLSPYCALSVTKQSEFCAFCAKMWVGFGHYAIRRGVKRWFPSLWANYSCYDLLHQTDGKFVRPFFIKIGALENLNPIQKNQKVHVIFRHFATKHRMNFTFDFFDPLVQDFCCW